MAKRSLSDKLFAASQSIWEDAGFAQNSFLCLFLVGSIIALPLLIGIYFPTLAVIYDLLISLGIGVGTFYYADKFFFTNNYSYRNQQATSLISLLAFCTGCTAFTFSTFLAYTGLLVAGVTLLPNVFSAGIYLLGGMVTGCEQGYALIISLGDCCFKRNKSNKFSPLPGPSALPLSVTNSATLSQVVGTGNSTLKTSDPSLREGASTAAGLQPHAFQRGVPSNRGFYRPRPGEYETTVARILGQPLPSFLLRPRLTPNPNSAE